MNYEDKIKKAKDKEEIKIIVREMFYDLFLDDITFNEIIYDCVIPRLKDFNIVWDEDDGDKINYEEILKENY